MKKSFRVLMAIGMCLASISLAGLIQPEHALAQFGKEVAFTGTAVETFADPGVGAPVGWIVELDPGIFVQSLEARLRVGRQSYLPAGTVDPAIEPGDQVEVLGFLNPHGSDPTYVSLNGPAYYIVRVADTQPPTIESMGTWNGPTSWVGCSRPVSLTIRANVTDDRGLAWVRLYHQPHSGSSVFVTMDYASGDVYQATFDTHAEAIILSYYIEARDLAGNVSRTVTQTMEPCEGPELDVAPTRLGLPSTLNGRQPGEVMLNVERLNPGESVAEVAP